MKIAFIGQKGIPARSGGVEKHVEKLATRLAGLGHEVTVYTRPNYTSPKIKRFKKVRLLSLPSIATKHLDAISHTFLATLDAMFRDYDVIHYHSIGPTMLSFLPRYFKPGTRVVATFHSRDYFHKKWNLFARYVLRFGEYVTCHVPERTIAVSENLAEHAHRAYGREVSYIPNGAEVKVNSDLSFLNAIGLKPGKYVLSVSRLVEHKGIHYLIKAFQELEDTTKLPNNYKLVIVGAPAHTSEYEAYLKNLAGGRPSILFLGERHGQELEALFTHAGLFVQPSEDEGLSLALLEAMAYGRLALVSAIPANLEVIRGGAGVSFPVKNVKALKEQMAYYVNRPDEAEVIGDIGRKRIETHYSWDAIARRTVEVYQELVKEKMLRSRIPFGTKHVA